MKFLETHHASSVFATGMGLRTPYAVPACFKAVSVKPTMQAFCLKRGGGGGLPPPPRFLEPCKLASKQVRVSESHHVSSVCKWGRGQRPLRHPGFLKPCKLASKQVCVFESHHASIICKWAEGVRPPTPPLVEAVQACFKACECF